MGEFTDDEDDDPTPTAAEPVAAVWPDEKHIKSAISAVENFFSIFTDIKVRFFQLFLRVL